MHPCGYERTHATLCMLIQSHLRISATVSSLYGNIKLRPNTLVQEVPTWHHTSQQEDFQTQVICGFPQHSRYFYPMSELG